MNRFNRMKPTLMASLLLTVPLISNADAAHDKLTAETRTVAEKWAAHYVSGSTDVMKWLDYFHEDAIATYFVNGKAHFLGKESLVAFYGGLSETGYDHESGIRIDKLALLVDGDVAVLRYRARLRRPVGDYDQQYMHMYRWRDGKIIEMNGFVDPHLAERLALNAKFLKDMGLE